MSEIYQLYCERCEYEGFEPTDDGFIDYYSGMIDQAMDRLEDR